MRNWLVSIEDRNTDIVVVLPNIQSALGVVNTFIIKGCRASVCETKADVTHKTGAAAESFINIEQMQLAVV